MATSVIGNNPTRDFAGLDDTWLNSSNVTQNNDTSGTFWCGYNDGTLVIQGLQRFTGLANLPSPSTVSAVVLNVTENAGTSSGNTQTLSAFKCLKPWVSSAANYNTYDGTNAWGTAGCLGAGVDYDLASGPLFTINADGYLGGNDQWTMTATAAGIAYIQAIINGTAANNGWVWIRTSVGNAEFAQWISQEGGSGTTITPQLSVTYTTQAALVDQQLDNLFDSNEGDADADLITILESSSGIVGPDNFFPPIPDAWPWDDPDGDDDAWVMQDYVSDVADVLPPPPQPVEDAWPWDDPEGDEFDVLDPMLMAPVGPNVGQTAPLDGQSTGLWGAYSVEQPLLSTYGGAAVRVRRSSDNAELDIGFNAAGTLDVATLLTFVGAGNGFVKIWYDHSGHGYDFRQATTTAQAQIVTGGVFLGGVKGNGTSTGYQTTAVNSIRATFGLFVKASDSNTGLHEMLENGPAFNLATGGTLLTAFGSANDYAAGTGTITNTYSFNESVIVATTPHVIAAAIDHSTGAFLSSAVMYLDGNVKAGTSVGGTTPPSGNVPNAQVWNAMAQNNAAARWCDGLWSAFAIYEATMTAATMASISNALWPGPVEDAWSFDDPDGDDQAVGLLDYAPVGPDFVFVASQPPEDAWPWDDPEGDATDEEFNDYQPVVADIAAPTLILIEDAWPWDDHEGDDTAWTQLEAGVVVADVFPPLGPEDAWPWDDHEGEGAPLDHQDYLPVGPDFIPPPGLIEDAWPWDDHEGDDWDQRIDSVPVVADVFGPVEDAWPWGTDDETGDEAPLAFDEYLPVGLDNTPPRAIEDAWPWDDHEGDEEPLAFEEYLPVGPPNFPGFIEDAWDWVDPEGDDQWWTHAEYTVVGKDNPPLPFPDGWEWDDPDGDDRWWTHLEYVPVGPAGLQPVTTEGVRIYFVNPEARTLVPNLETRVVVPNAEARKLLPNAELRTIFPDPEARTVAPNPEARTIFEDVNNRTIGE